MPPSRPPVRLVCFDLGGVVLRICHSWSEGCAAAGLDTRGDVAAIRGRTGGWDELNAEFQTGNLDLDAFADRLSDLLDGLYTPDEIKRVHAVWIHGEYDGVEALIGRIQEETRCATALLSNTSPAHWETMPQYPAVMRVPHRFASHEIGVRKPDAEAYRVVEQGTGYRGDEVLFFDDRPENIEGAAAVGWRTGRIDPTAPTAAQVLGALREHEVL